MAQRSELKQYLDCRLRFSGIVSRFRQTTSSRIRGTIKTVMLKDIRMAGQIDILTDHVWIRHGRWVRHLEKGDVISFHARVVEYKKGYQSKPEEVETDYQLVYPTNVQKESLGGNLD